MQVKINKDINDYQESVFIGMTMRQAVLGIAGVVIIAASYFLTGGMNDSMLGSWIAIGLGMPCFMFGFARPHKLPLEKFIAVWAKSQLLTLRKRKYVAENKYYEECFKEDGHKPLKKAKKGRVKKCRG